MDWHLEIEASANGRVSSTTVLALDANGNTITSDKADLSKAAERTKAAERLAKALREEKHKATKTQVVKELQGRWKQLLDSHRKLKAEQQEQAREQAMPPPADAPWRNAVLPRGFAITPLGFVVEVAEGNFLTRGPV